MKNKKGNKKELESKIKEENELAAKRRKKKDEKIKYRHKNHWLAEFDDDDDALPIYKDEEEE
jgi:hypothetical protein